LRVYLGAAPGVGKTYATLQEGRRARERGRDVALGFVETYKRPLTEAAIDDLEVIPRREQTYLGSSFEEMDLDAILARRPGRSSSTRWRTPTCPAAATRSAGRTWGRSSTRGST
jgi:K+-sensing histidine kinase KdpD